MRPIRVAHIPGSHPYVNNLLGTDASAKPAFISLNDVIPSGRAAGQWWPPVMLDPEWIAAHAQDFDVMHLHFGFESFSVAHLESCADALESVGRPLVFTVHDLENPQLFDQTHHERQLDVLLARADVVTTLTAGAAREILRRWGREAIVIQHPHLLAGYDDEADSLPDPGSRPTATVGMHLSDLRPGTDARRATANLIDAVRSLRASGLAVEAEVHMRTTVRDESTRALVVDACQRADGVSLVEHPRLSENELVRSVADLDAYVLPYRHGTHSGWIELCFDLGVPVLAPTAGHWLDQHHEPGAVIAFDPDSALSLETGLAAVLTHRADIDRRSQRSQRRAQRREQGAVIAAAHADVYRSAIALSSITR